MKTIFDKTIREELISRVHYLNENSTAQWGKMNVYQMIKHCILCEEMYLGKTPYKRSFLGYFLGRIALNQLMKDDKPKKNATHQPNKNSKFRKVLATFQPIKRNGFRSLKNMKIIQKQILFTCFMAK
jgi:hypothetical protein